MFGAYDVDRQLSKTIQPLPTSEDQELRWNWNAPMAISTHQPDRFYMGSQYLHKSEDMGDTWQIISPDLTTNDPAKQNQRGFWWVVHGQFRCRKSHDHLHYC